MARSTPKTTLRLFALLAVLSAPRFACAQGAVSAPDEPIYWRQNLLTVPYQWTSDSGPQNPAKVLLYVSKNRGSSWQAVGEAQPQLLAFNYRAEADGEYWFSIRTSDAGGAVRLPPTNNPDAMQPELRVIVDTAMPQIESLTAQMRDDDVLEARWRVTDPHLSSHSCNVEVQSPGTNNWQPMPLTGATEVSPGTWEGVATFAVTTSAAPAAVRATAIDLAGNRAVFQSSVATTAIAGALPKDAAPFRNQNPDSEPGWTSTSAPPSGGVVQQALPQHWAADRSANATLDFGDEDDARITYGDPVVAGATNDSNAGSPDDQLTFPPPTTEDRPLGNVPQHTASQSEPVSPFRQVSVSHAINVSNSKTVTEVSPRATGESAPPLPANPLARLVNTRTFALEYELAEIGSGGVAKVEVWSTRDGGQTWNPCATDDDNRTPVNVTVDEEGEYGFSIVVSAAAGGNAAPPQSGDTPALWVNVDLQPPLAQIVAVDTRRGDIESELQIRWEADDDNLQSRPISLYYSSRPAGPWTSIAAELENSGEFCWPLARHVPRKIYLKLEARDTAGNIAAFQTSDPVVVENEPAATNWLRLPPVK